MTRIWYRTRIGLAATLAIAMIGLGRTGSAAATTHEDAQLINEAHHTVSVYKKTDPGIDAFFRRSVGYAVFPGIGKGAVGIGGAHGTGVLFEHGTPVGKVTMNQVTIGAQLGGQKFNYTPFTM
jgi:lipid-binding SYLF domain-containing protein